MTTATAPKLYEIAAHHRQIFDAISDNDGELTPELEAALNESSDSLASKLEACCIRNLSLGVAASGIQGLIAGVQAELDRLKAAHAGIVREQANLQGYMQRSLEAAGETRVDTERFSVRIQQNPPSAKWLGNPDAIPEAYQRVKTTVDFDAKKALADHKAGAMLPVDVVINRTKKLVIK